MVDKKSKTPGVVINQIRAAILDGLYKPGDRLLEADLAAAFHVSRSPVREALQALESEGTLSATPYAGAIVRPLSAAEASEIADIRLGLISLALKPAHPHLAPAHFDLAYPTPESRPRQHEALIEWYRKGRLAEALRAFKKIYLEMVDHIVDNLEAQKPAKSVE